MREVKKLRSEPTRKAQVTSELAGIKSEQTSLMQQIQDQHAEGRPRLVILDDQPIELEITREKLVMELAATEEPVANFGEKIDRLKTQFDPAQAAIAIGKLIFLARNYANEQAKRRLIPILVAYKVTV